MSWLGDNNSQFYSENQWEANTEASRPLVAGSSDGGKVYGEIEEEISKPLRVRDLQQRNKSPRGPTAALAFIYRIVASLLALWNLLLYSL